MKKFGKEIAAAGLAASIAIGAVNSHEKDQKPSTHEIKKAEPTAKDGSANSQQKQDVQRKKGVNRDKKETKENKTFDPYQFLYQEFDEMGVDNELYQAIFETKTKEFKNNRFKGDPEVEKKYFEHVTKDGRYKLRRKIIERVAERHEVPAKLLEAMCFLESGCQPDKINARTEAGGYFQFLPGTAKKYGLAINKKKDIDERNHLGKSADAAAEYLADLHERFGQWGLALSAYAGGAGKLSRRLRETFPQSFPDRQVKRQIRQVRRDIATTKKQIQDFPSKRLSYRITLNKLRKRMKELLQQEASSVDGLTEVLKNEGVNLATLASPKYGNMEDVGSVEYAVKVQIVADLLHQYDQAGNPAIEK